MTNTDLKLKYGILNFKKLSEYDDNFTKFVSMLPDYYNRLKDAGYESLGNELLELAVEQGADSKNVYSLLANAFISMSKADRLAELIEKAKQLNSLSRMESFLCLRVYRPIPPRPVINSLLLYYNLFIETYSNHPHTY